MRTAALYPLLKPVSSCRITVGPYTPTRGHVVLLELDGVRTVRRIAGLAGDKIAVTDGALHVNGESRQTDVLDRRVMCLAGVYPRCRCQIRQERVGSRTYPVQSLHPTEAGSDARCVVRPDAPESTVPPGSVYLLADNRDAARDSRTLGSLPASRILARVLGCKASAPAPDPELTPDDLRRIQRELDR